MGTVVTRLGEFARGGTGRHRGRRAHQRHWWYGIDFATGLPRRHRHRYF